MEIRKDNVFNGEGVSNVNGSKYVAKEGCSVLSSVDRRIISMTLNVSKDDIATLLKNEIKIPLEVALKKFNANLEFERLADNEKEAGEEMLKKITAFSEDETFLEIVPVIVTQTCVLQGKVQDPNLAFIGDVKALSVDKLNSKYVVKHIIEKTNGTSEVFLNTPLVIVSTALSMLNGVIAYENVFGRNPLYNVAVSFNGTGYTVSFINKYYKEI